MVDQPFSHSRNRKQTGLVAAAHQCALTIWAQGATGRTQTQSHRGQGHPNTGVCLPEPKCRHWVLMIGSGPSNVFGAICYCAWYCWSCLSPNPFDGTQKGSPYRAGMALCLALSSSTLSQMSICHFWRCFTRQKNISMLLLPKLEGRGECERK